MLYIFFHSYIIHYVDVDGIDYMSGTRKAFRTVSFNVFCKLGKMPHCSGALYE